MIGTLLRWGHGHGIAALTGSLILGVAVSLGLFQQIDSSTLDRFFGLRGVRPARSPIAIIVFNDETLTLLNTAWPPPRAAYAALLRRLNQDPPAVIGFDLVFSMPSAHGDTDDEAFASALRETRQVVLASYIDYTSTGTPRGWHTKLEHELPLPILRRGAAVGHNLQDYDRDGIARRMSLLHAIDGAKMPSFNLQVAQAALRQRGTLPLREPPNGGLIPFRGGREAFRYFAYQDVMSGAVSNASWRDKIVLIGVDVSGLGDYHRTSFSRHELMPGVVIHANVIDALLTDGALKELGVVTYVIIALWCLVLGIYLARRSAVGLFLIAIAIAATTYTASFGLFVFLGVWIAPTAPCVGFILGLISGWIVRYRLLADGRASFSADSEVGARS